MMLKGGRDGSLAFLQQCFVSHEHRELVAQRFDLRFRPCHPMLIHVTGSLMIRVLVLQFDLRLNQIYNWLLQPPLLVWSTQRSPATPTERFGFGVDGGDRIGAGGLAVLDLLRPP